MESQFRIGPDRKARGESGPTFLAPLFARNPETPAAIPIMLALCLAADVAAPKITRRWPPEETI